MLEDLQLCYSAEDLAVGSVRSRADLHLQLAALAGLMIIVVLAGLTMHRAATRAEELSSQKSAFVSAVSHELRTPLTTIRMHAEMLRDGLVPPDRQERFHGQMVQQSERLSRLVDNVLEMSRIEEGRRVLDLTEQDLIALTSRIVAEQEPFARDRGFELRGPKEGEPLLARVDEEALAQILVNLVDNAVKYAASGEERKISVEVSRLGQRALLRVVDRGPGIPEGETSRVFERFHRVADPGGEGPPGTGLGLALVRELARAHGGDAEARRPEAGGCEVRVTLPLAGVIHGRSRRSGHPKGVSVLVADSAK